MLNIPWPKFDETALAAASHMGNRAIAEYLLEQGAPMTVCTAAMLGMTERVAEYLDADESQANARGAHGISIMFHAAMSGNTDVTELLLARGGGEDMNDALHGAIDHGHTKMVAWLLEHGVTDINEPNFQGKPALTVAQEKGHSDIEAMLLKYGQ